MFIYWRRELLVKRNGCCGLEGVNCRKYCRRVFREVCELRVDNCPGVLREYRNELSVCTPEYLIKDLIFRKIFGDVISLQCILLVLLRQSENGAHVSVGIYDTKTLAVQTKLVNLATELFVARKIREFKVIH